MSEAGPYRGLCKDCRPLVASERAQARLARGVDDEIDKDTGSRVKRPTLAGAVQDLVPLARNLEKALETRKAANVRARTELGRFQEGLQTVQRVARSLLNTSQPPDPSA